MGMLSREVILNMGFAAVGEDVRISDKASFYNLNRISLGDHVRIDDYCVLSAGKEIKIGNYVHIAVCSSLIGAELIELADFSGLSSRVSIYSTSDDYSGRSMTNPTVPIEYRNVTHGRVYLNKHVIIGAGSVILPGVELGTGVAVGALSLVKKSCDAFGIYVGNPAKRVATRKQDLLDLEYQLMSSTGKMQA